MNYLFIQLEAIVPLPLMYSPSTIEQIWSTLLGHFLEIYISLVHSLLWQIYGDKDTDGFYRGEVRGRMGLIPCNMVSEIRAEDEETMDQLIKQGFLPLSTPVDRLGTSQAERVQMIAVFVVY